jgi:hypothetical protein
MMMEDLSDQSPPPSLFFDCVETPSRQPEASKTLVCFGQARDGMGGIEVLSAEKAVTREETVPLVYLRSGQEELRRSRTGCSQEGIRLFHSQPSIEDDEDDLEETLSFESENHQREPIFQDPDPACFEPTTPPRLTSKAKQSSKLLAVIDNLEKKLEDVDSAGTKTKRLSSSRWKFPKFMRSRSTKESTEQLELKHRRHQEAPVPITVTPRKRSSTPAHTKPSSSPWTRIKNSMPNLTSKKTKKNRADTALLIPKKEYNYFSQDALKWSIFADKHSHAEEISTLSESATMNESSEDEVSKPKRRFITKSNRKFFRHLLLRSFAGKHRDRDEESFGELGPDRTRSLSLLEDEGDAAIKNMSRSIDKNEEAFIDNLVQYVDNNSSLEQGLNMLEERIRSRSSAKSTVSVADAIFSTSFLDMSSLESKSKEPSPRRSPSTEPGSPQNESIPSFASLEDFLTSPVNDSTNSASIEALLFEQELEKLSTEELAELLDAELEKLMREGYLS